MNIGIFTDCYYPQINGVVTSVMTMKAEMEKRGHKVIIITVKVPGYVDEDPNVIRIKSVPFYKWSEFRVALPFFYDVYLKLRKQNLDLIHTHTEFSVGMFGKNFARLHKIPRLHTYHTMYEDYTHYIVPFGRVEGVAKSLVKRYSKVYVKKYDAVIAPSEKTKEALIRYGVNNEIYVMPTGVDLERFERLPVDDTRLEKIRRDLGIELGDHIILSLGRVSEEKSIDIIIRQMPNLFKTVPNVKLLIIGDGPAREGLEALTAKLALSDKVVFGGSVDRQEVPLYYSLAEVFVSASHTETQGLTILEAMASGTPVAVWKDENIKDVVEDRVSGRLFGSEEELTMCLQDMLGSSQQNAIMADRAFEKIMALSNEAFGDKAERIYDDITRRKGVTGDGNNKAVFRKNKGRK